jgi:hypothetical protein
MRPSPVDAPEGLAALPDGARDEIELVQQLA